MTSRWIRLDTTWDSSKWIAALPAPSQLAWIKLLCYMKAHGDSRSVKSLSVEVASRQWTVTKTAVSRMLEAAISDKALVLDGDEWVVTGWYRQTDTTQADRAKRYRERQKGLKDPSRDDSAVTRDVTPVTHTETETETETTTLSDDFGDFWSTYPKRSGSNPKKKALTRWRSNVKKGVTSVAMISGAHRYARFMEATGKVGTEYVQQAVTFLGQNEGWKESWIITESDTVKREEPDPGVEFNKRWAARQEEPDPEGPERVKYTPMEKRREAPL